MVSLCIIFSLSITSHMLYFRWCACVLNLIYYPVTDRVTVQDDLVTLLNVVVMMPDFELGDQVNSLSLSSCSLSS